MARGGPIKRSIMIAGHATSVSLEPIFWDALRAAAEEQRLPLNALVARIDAERVAERSPANLASALRVWLYERATKQAADAQVPAQNIVDCNANDLQ